MNQQTKPWGAIIVMIALFAMIAFVTNLCSPMANIIKAQGDIPEVLAQIGMKDSEWIILSLSR